MKSIWLFLKWHWSKWSFTQRIWLLGCVFFGAGFADWIRDGAPPTATYIAWGIWLSVFAKWFIWDATISSWNRYKKEQKDLLETIREGK